jgi:YVTN family beta-propeller protein
LGCRQPPASIAVCSQRRRFAVAQARRRGDPDFEAVEHPANVGSDPRALSQSAFITSQNSNTVWVIDTVTTTVVVTIPVLSNSYGVAVNPNGRRVY